MARERNPERDKARRIWLDSGGTLTARQVAEQVGVKPEQVRKWKSLDSWAAELEAQKPPRKRGGQPGNKNAAGAGAPHGNRNAETHGAYSTVRLADLPDEQREYIESITLDTGTNMLSELQLLIAKEADLQSKIAKIENGDPDALYIDRVVEMRAPKSTERLEQQQEKLETLRRKRDDLTWEIDSGPDGKPPSKAKQKQLDALQREIAALEDTTADRQMELEKSSYKVNMQTVIKASAFDRAMKLEAELNKISLLNRMTARTPGGFSNKTNHKNTEKERNTMDGIEKITTVDGLKAAFPDLTRQIEDAATTAERKRIQDIEDVALAGYESIVNDAKFNNPIAAGDVAKAIVAAQKKQGGTYIKNRDDDAQKSGAGDVGAGAHEGAGDDGGDNDVDKAIDKLFPATK